MFDLKLAVGLFVADMPLFDNGYTLWFVRAESCLCIVAAWKPKRSL
jgi:hypothetical protein